MSRVWLVTGSSRGLGRHIVAAAAASGDRVVATARHPEDLSELVADGDGRVAAMALDVTDQRCARDVVADVLQEFGRLDVVVNNAGQADLGSVEDTPDSSFWNQHAVSYQGLVHVTRAALAVFRSQGHGRFIQISSLGARMGSPGLASYQAAKAAATIFSMSLAAEVGPLGIDITVVEPGNLRTDMISSKSMALFDSAQDYAPTVGAMAARLKRENGMQPGDPAKAAEVIVQVSKMAEPPLRFPLGSDAVEFARVAADRLAQEDARWQKLSTAIDYEPSSGE
jgi:NAD(P)-dependent dehydrogenase (short-subunit alcohol dehydrogenase family)